MDVAICVGNPPNVLAAAATSVEMGVDELEIANALEPLQVVRAKTVDCCVPAECEFVLEGTVYLRPPARRGAVCRPDRDVRRGAPGAGL